MRGSLPAGRQVGGGSTTLNPTPACRQAGRLPYLKPPLTHSLRLVSSPPSRGRNFFKNYNYAIRNFKTRQRQADS